MVRGGEIVRTPGLQFPNGLHVQITLKNKQNQEPTTESDTNTEISRNQTVLKYGLYVEVAENLTADEHDRLVLCKKLGNNHRVFLNNFAEDHVKLDAFQVP